MSTCQRTRSLPDPCPVRRGSNTRSGPKNAGHSTRKFFPVNPKTPFFALFPSPRIFHPLETFFPIIGKLPKIFSNHWKNRSNFSNHWKTFFQPLENSPALPPPANPLRFPMRRGRAGSPLPAGARHAKARPGTARTHITRPLPAGWHPPIQWHPMARPGIRRRGDSPPYPPPSPSSHPLPRPTRDIKENGHIPRVYSPLLPP